MTFYESPFQKISYDAENQIIFQEYFAQSAELTDDLLKKDLTQLAEFAHKNPVKGILADTRNFLFSIHPDLQTWIVENIFGKLFAVGLTKVAILLSEDFIAQLATEQVLDDAELSNSALQNRYFSAFKDAFAWLTEKSD
jgi:hypothetical protein